MKFYDAIASGITHIQQNRLRAGLSILGILIGIASVLCMMAIGDGTKKLSQTTSKNLVVRIKSEPANTAIVPMLRNPIVLFRMLLKPARYMQKGIGVTWCYEQMKPQNSNFRDVGNVYARSLIALAPRYRSNSHPFATHKDWKRTEKRLVP